MRRPLTTLALLLLTTGTLLAVDSYVTFTQDGSSIVAMSNGIPTHPTGQFPNRRNPNTIRPQSHVFRIPAVPRLSARVTWARGKVGLARNGVPFDPGTAEFWRGDRRSGWMYEALGGFTDLGTDASNAHVQPTGAYHYHGMPEGLVKELGGGSKSVVLGYAGDGFSIRNHLCLDGRRVRSGYRLRSGRRPGGGLPGGSYDGMFNRDWEYVAGLGDLDEVNGHMGDDGVYHYHITYEYPYIQRGYHGIPDESFLRGPRP